MKFLYFVYCILFLVYFWNCTNIENATPSNRNSFIHIYEGPESFTASDIIEVSDGFIVLGNMKVTSDSLVTVTFKTDKKGNRMGDFRFYSGGIGKSIKPFTNAVFDGYLIIGDSIQTDPNSTIVGNIEIYSARLLAINQNLDSVASFTIADRDTTSGRVKTDIKGISITVTDAGKIVIMATYRTSGSTDKPWVIILNNDLSLSWQIKNDALVRDYFNCKSVHYSNGKIIWASSLVRQQGTFSYKYISVNTLLENIDFSNYSLMGEQVDKSFTASDIQPTSQPDGGYGVIGTYSEIDGSKKNILFLKVDAGGNILQSDSLFIDAVLSKTTSTTSSIDDTGESLISTNDGGFAIAGTMKTTPVGNITVGNGERDIFLVKIDAFGNVVWTKILGGQGDEVVSTIRETSDKGLLICGTNNLGDYSSIFIIKTDSNGEMKN